MIGKAEVVVSRDIRAALAGGRAVVALESTVVTHGMPYPRNLETARALERIIRDGGAIPATIAVVDGVARVGLEDDELDSLATRKGVMKLSRADLAFAVATGKTGSTTVAATMILAARAGIAVFATGGIGGVHRGAEQSFDISADLEELARTDVCVIAAGAKAILDLPKTLEVLETKGVPVIGWRTDDFPAFWSRDSGLRVPLRIDDAGTVARLREARAALKLGGGMLIANPVPDAAAIPRSDLERHIEAALGAATAAGVRGKDVTPFVLAALNQATGGRSLETNIALIENNARVATEIALAIAKAGGVAA